MSPTHPLSILVNRQLRHVGGDLIWQCTTSVSDVEQYKISSLFVKQMVLAVAELEIDHPLQQTVLWNNKYIRAANINTILESLERKRCYIFIRFISTALLYLLRLCNRDIILLIHVTTYLT